MVFLKDVLEEVAVALSKANESIERVRELHKDNNGRCSECVGAVLMEIYPCPTIKALDGN